MTVAIVLKGYPRLSETFIAQELLGLQQNGLDMALYSLRHPTDTATHPMHRAITAPVTYLPEYVYEEPARVWRGWLKARQLPGYGRALRLWLKDWGRDRTANRGRRFAQACVMAAELPPTITRIHAHFLHTPGSVARYAATMRGVPLSYSAHAKDIWTIPDWEKREKLADCDWMVTCTAANAAHLKTLAPPNRVHLQYHGLDFNRFPDSRPDSGRDGSNPDDPVRFVSVGRLVPKKGYDRLLRALALLPADLQWRFDHIGGGEQKQALKDLAASLGLTDRITWHGAHPQEVVIARVQEGDIFVLPSIITADGDRDGLPNVLMEAQAMGVVCLASDVSGIPELIISNETGVLVPDGPPEVFDPAFAAALTQLATDANTRAHLATAGTARVKTVFGHKATVQSLMHMFTHGRLS